VRRLQRQIEVGRPDPPPSPSPYVFESRAMRELVTMIHRVATRPSNVLIEGESGTGKEVVAELLHQASASSETSPFIAVHCAALPETLLESELFGHERGAFTGADKQLIGRLELADGGTLFLDEIGEVPLSMQVKLLRVLEQRELTRVGGRHIIKVNFRLVAATNRKLESEVRAGRFREDLFYRLNVVRLHVPPLRERREDIGPLLRFFLNKFAIEQGTPPPRLTPEIESRLEAYHWPGNVRELRNLAERLSIFASGRTIESSDFPGNFGFLPAGGRSPMAADDLVDPDGQNADLLDLQQIERQTIERALARFRGNRSAAAQALGISRRTLQRKVKEYRMVDAGGDADDDGDDEE
jgi:DNA-binding NtrC family response regulator